MGKSIAEQEKALEEEIAGISSDPVELLLSCKRLMKAKRLSFDQALEMHLTILLLGLVKKYPDINEKRFRQEINYIREFISKSGLGDRI